VDDFVAVGHDERARGAPIAVQVISRASSGISKLEEHHPAE